MTPSRTAAGTVPVYEVRANRTSDGYLQITIQSETLTTGWRIYTHHQLTNNNSTLEVRLKGWPSANSGYRQVDHPYASPIIVLDRSNVINRIIVHGSNGSRTVAINASGAVSVEPYTPPASVPYRPPRSDQYPSDGSAITIGPPLAGTPGGSSATTPQNPSPSGGVPGASTTTLSSFANQVANDLEVFQAELVSFVGLYRNPDGSYEVLGQRKPTSTEQQMIQTVTFMTQSVRQIANNPDNASVRRNYSQRLR